MEQTTYVSIDEAAARKVQGIKTPCLWRVSAPIECETSHIRIAAPILGVLAVKGEHDADSGRFNVTIIQITEPDGVINRDDDVEVRQAWERFSENTADYFIVREIVFNPDTTIQMTRFSGETRPIAWHNESTWHVRSPKEPFCYYAPPVTMTNGECLIVEPSEEALYQDVRHYWRIGEGMLCAFWELENLCPTLHSTDVEYVEQELPRLIRDAAKPMVLKREIAGWRSRVPHPGYLLPKFAASEPIAHVWVSNYTYHEYYYRVPRLEPNIVVRLAIFGKRVLDLAFFEKNDAELRENLLWQRKDGLQLWIAEQGE